MACYSIGDLSRRDLMKMSAAIAGANAFFPIDVVVAAALQPTPRQVLGPFYPRTSLARTSDLTHVPGRTGRAAGLVLDVMGRVLNISGEPVANAKLDVWQANSHGRYTNPRDDNPAPLDPNFEGSATLESDAEGRYRFVTIKPAAYRDGNAMRPAHIHFKVSGRHDRLVTQMYFEGDPYNAEDPFLNSAEHKELLIAEMLAPPKEFEPDSKAIVFDIVLYNG